MRKEASKKGRTFLKHEAGALAVVYECIRIAICDYYEGDDEAKSFLFDDGILEEFLEYFLVETKVGAKEIRWRL